MKVVWSLLAEQRALEAVDYIARDRPEGAETWLEALIERVAKLDRSARRGRASSRLVGPRIVRSSTLPIASFIGLMPHKLSFLRCGIGAVRGIQVKWMTVHNDRCSRQAAAGGGGFAAAFTLLPAAALGRWADNRHLER